jgi:hypothetical protein
MKQPGLGLSAFSLPKLKRDVAAKLNTSTSSRDAGQHGIQSAAAAAANNSKAEQQQQIDADTEALPADENVDPSSPLLKQAATASAAAKAAPANKPATARKGRRAKTRVSEQHTVYYDALGSPDDASARTQQKHSRFAAAAAAPASVHSKPSKQPAAAVMDADACTGEIYGRICMISCDKPHLFDILFFVYIVHSPGKQ